MRLKVEMEKVGVTRAQLFLQNKVLVFVNRGRVAGFYLPCEILRCLPDKVREEMLRLMGNAHCSGSSEAD